MAVFDAVLSVVLLVLGISGAVTALTRIVKHKTTDGVSQFSTMLGMMANFSWIAYGIIHAIPLQLANNIPAALCATLTMVMAFRTGAMPKPSKWFWFAAAYALFATFFVMTIGLLALSVILTTLAVTTRIPQLIESWKNPGGEGLSLPAFGLQISAALGWTVYGVMHMEGAVIASSSWAVLSFAFIMVRTVQGRRRPVPTTVPETTPVTTTAMAA